MDVKEAQDKIQQAEGNITNILRNLQNETGLKVTDLDANIVIDTHGSYHIDKVSIGIRV